MKKATDNIYRHIKSAVTFSPGRHKRKTKRTLKEEYFDKMRETSDEVYRKIITLIKSEFRQDKELLKTVLQLVEKRRKKNLARPFIVRLGYELAQGKEWRRTITPGMLMELENISTYQSNASFDSKYGVADDELSKMNQIIAAFLTRNLIQKEIDNTLSESENSKIVREFSKIVTEIDMYDYVGQFKEMNQLGIQDFDFEMDMKEYLEIYLKVKYLYGGKWIRDLLISGIVFSEAKHNLPLKTISEFGVACGTPYTMINDLSDFCTREVERGYKTSITDQFKDVWNGRVTLPLFFATSKYSSASKKEKQFLIDCMNNKYRKSKKNTRRILNILLKSGALNFSYSIINHFRKKAKAIIKRLPKSKERSMLLLLNTSLRTNKFFSELKKKEMRLIELDPNITRYLDDFLKTIIDA